MTALLDPPRRRVREQLDSPLLRAGLALIASAGITSVLGLAYWTLAARRYDPAAVGATAALLAAMEVIAAVASLGLRTALIRFVPALGPRAPRVILAGYAAAGAVAAAGAGVLLLVHDRWFPELDLLESRVGFAWVLLSTVLWVVFSLQDSVLIGMRQARWVPVENAVYAVAKLALLVGLTAPLPRWGIYVSWTAPLALMIVAVSGPALLRLWRSPGEPVEHLTLTDLVRFSAGDQLATMLWLLTVDGLPLLVLALDGAESNAWYHIAWTMAYTLYLVSSALGSALLAEGAHEPGAIERHARRALRQGLAMVVPASLVVALGAPWLLHLFGADYAAEGDTLLRLLALSAIPHLVTSLFAYRERAHRRLRPVVTAYAALAVGVVGGSALLVPALGVTGAGVAWLGAQCLVAGTLVLTGLRDVVVGALPTRLLRSLSAPVHRVAGRRRRREAATRLRDLGLGPCTVLHATADLVVARADDAPHDVVKLPGRVREHHALRVLAADPVLAGWPVQVPRPVQQAERWSTETLVDGTTGEVAMAAGLRPDVVLRSGVTALAGLHQPTQQLLDRAPDALLASWIDDPVALVKQACPDRTAELDELARQLHEHLADRPVVVAWSHGDVTPGNLFVDEQGDVTGLVDWEGARADRLPEIDLLTLVLATRATAATKEFGEVTLDLLEHPWTEEEVAARAQGPNPLIPRETLVLLTWLHHVATNLAKSDTYRHHRTWLLRNVTDVLDNTVPVAEEKTPAPPRQHGRHRWLLRAAIPAAATALWFLALRNADPRDLTDLGLVSLIPPAGWLGLLLLVAGFSWAVHHEQPRAAGANLVALATIIWATPAVVYGTVRYSWAWKHLGIVDFIDRTGGVDPGIDVLPVYHNWPGFFSGVHVLQRWVGADSAVTIALWFPLVVGLVTLAAVALVARTFTKDDRVVLLTCWLFLLGNWVGQEYFSPQAYAYVLYLVAVALVLRGSRSSRPGAAVVLSVVLLAAAIATSHQLTPAMLTIAFVALALTRQAKVGAIAAIAAVCTLTWALWGATAFVGQNLVDLVEGLGAPVGNAEDNLVDAGGLSAGQQLVVLAGRLLVLALAALALVGLVRRWRAGLPVLAPLVLLVSPLVLLAANDFDGEILFRVLLFGLPFAAFFAAHALLAERHRWLATAATLVVSVAMLGGFLLAHFGKDGTYVFTPEEVAAVRWLHEQAPAGSLLVEGSRNYPTQFVDYEKFRYVPIDRESESAQRELARQPVRTLVRWMSNSDDAAAYVLLTRSQLRESPFLAELEDDLRASDRFEVAFENRDAVVFTVAGR